MVLCFNMQTIQAISLKYFFAPIEKALRLLGCKAFG